MEVVHGIEQAVLIVHETIECIAGAIGIGESESNFEVGRFVT